MRILVNVDALAPVGGVELSSLQVCRELATRGHQIDVRYRLGGELEPQWRTFADSIRQVPSFLVTQQRPVRDLRQMLPAVRGAGTPRPDAVWVNRAEHLVWGLLAARSSRAPLVCHLRTHPHFPAVRLLARGVGRFVAVSAYVRDLWVKAGLPPDQVDVVLNGVDERDYPCGGSREIAPARQRLGLAATGYVALYYGRLHADKGLDLLLEAWRRLGLGPDQATLVLAGDPYPTPEGAAYRDAMRAALPAGVRLLPMQRDVATLLHAADVVVLPAQWQEPFGRVVAEGLMSGRPVLASRVGGIPEQLTGEFSKLLFDPARPDELASLLAGMHDWRQAEPTLGERCAEHARTRLSLKTTVDGVEAALRAARFRTRRAGRVRPPADGDLPDRHASVAP